MNLVAQRSPITYALRDVVKIILGMEVGIARGPYDSNGDEIAIPYAVIHPRGKGRFWGSVDSPFECLAAQYQIKSVGLTDEQVQRMSDKIRVGLLTRDFDGSFINPVVMDGQAVMDIAPAMNAPGDAIIRGNVFEVDDVYTISVVVRQP